MDLGEVKREKEMDQVSFYHSFLHFMPDVMTTDNFISFYLVIILKRSSFPPVSAQLSVGKANM